MNKILIIFLIVIFCTLFAGCAKIGNVVSANASSQSISSSVSGSYREISGLHSSLPFSTISSPLPTVSPSDIQAASEFQKIIVQLDDLTNTLKEMDQIANDDMDMAIPTP